MPHQTHYPPHLIASVLYSLTNCHTIDAHQAHLFITTTASPSHTIYHMPMLASMPVRTPATLHDSCTDARTDIIRRQIAYLDRFVRLQHLSDASTSGTELTITDIEHHQCVIIHQ